MVSKDFSLTNFLILKAEQGVLPRRVIRFGIRNLLRRRLREIRRPSPLSGEKQLASFIKQLRSHAIAERTTEANTQHYELPPAFFQQVLGPYLKYSSALWESDVNSLEAAEHCMLQTTVERAEIGHDMNVLELGCGWGSLTFYTAQAFPNTHITALTNSSLQADYIRAECVQRNLTNIHVIKSDVATFQPQQSFDRIVSVEMFEHVRNYGELFTHVHEWLRPGGKLFVHVFAHANQPYLFEDGGDSDWMARYFFSGGAMPSHGLLPAFRGDLTLEHDWRINGKHYARTLEAWLVNMDRRKANVYSILSQYYPPEEVDVWVQRWRMFFMACAELFAFDDGHAWGVSHYLFSKPTT